MAFLPKRKQELSLLSVCQWTVAAASVGLLQTRGSRHTYTWTLLSSSKSTKVKFFSSFGTHFYLHIAVRLNVSLPQTFSNLPWHWILIQKQLSVMSYYVNILLYQLVFELSVVFWLCPLWGAANVVCEYFLPVLFCLPAQILCIFAYLWLATCQTKRGITVETCVTISAVPLLILRTQWMNTQRRSLQNRSFLLIVSLHLQSADIGKQF